MRKLLPFRTSSKILKKKKPKQIKEAKAINKTGIEQKDLRTPNRKFNARTREILRQKSDWTKDITGFGSISKKAFENILIILKCFTRVGRQQTSMLNILLCHFV